MSFPPAHALIGAGLAEAVIAVWPIPRWKAWTVSAALAISPDFDIALGLFLGKGGAYHGTFSHSLSAVVVIALLGYAIGGGRWALLAGLGYGSHLLVDLLDDSGPTNLMLWWPFTGERPYSLGKVFPKVYFEGEGVVESALSLLRPGIFRQLLHQTLLGAAIFAALLGIAAALRRLRRAPGRETIPAD